MKTIAICLFIIIIIIVLFSDNDYEHMDTLGSDNRIVVNDASGNLDSIDANKILVPKGLIAMWSGDTVPSGWNLCDGNAGKDVNGLRIPDLRGRFVVMVNLQANPSPNKDSANAVLNTYSMGSIGGEQLHTLTENEMLHKHDTNVTRLCRSSGGSCDIVGGADATKLTSLDPKIDIPPTPHNNLPPYYALAFIIKVV